MTYVVEGLFLKIHKFISRAKVLTPIGLNGIRPSLTVAHLRIIQVLALHHSCCWFWFQVGDENPGPLHCLRLRLMRESQVYLSSSLVFLSQRAQELRSANLLVALIVRNLINGIRRLGVGGVARPRK